MNVTYYDHENNKVVNLNTDDEEVAAIIVLLDRIAGAIERYVDNRT